MAIPGVERLFVDTTVLVYAAIASAPWHAESRRLLGDLRRAGTETFVSRQVLREYLAVLTRPQTYAVLLPAAEAVNDIHDFEQRFQIAEDGPAVTLRLLQLLEEVEVGGKQIHDANIVATMLVHGIGTVVTHNVGDFKRSARFVEVRPAA